MSREGLEPGRTPGPCIEGREPDRKRQSTTSRNDHHLAWKHPPRAAGHKDETGQTQSKSLSARIEKLHTSRQGFACKGKAIRTIRSGNSPIAIVYNEFRAGVNDVKSRAIRFYVANVPTARYYLPQPHYLNRESVESKYPCFCFVVWRGHHSG